MEDSPHGRFATQRVNWACRSENSNVNVGQTFAKVPKWIGIFATWKIRHMEDSPQKIRHMVDSPHNG